MNRADYENMVNRPGKFEGENPYVPYFWEQSWDDMEGDEDYPIFIYTVTENDVEIFPELKIGEQIRLYEREDGFVCEEL